MTWTNQADVSACSWTHLEKITFNQSFVFKHQIFSFENCCLDKKRRSKVVGTFQKFWGWGAETFTEHLLTWLAVIGTIQAVSFHDGKGMTVHCHPVPVVQCRPT